MGHGVLGMVKIEFLEVEIQNCFTIAIPDRKGYSVRSSKRNDDIREIICFFGINAKLKKYRTTSNKDLV